MSTASYDLTDRVALVTGSSRGLGFVLARGLALAGATVVLNGRDEQRLTAAAQRLKSEGLSVGCSAFDATDENAVSAAVADLMSTYGGIGILVNNAGIQRRAPLEDFPENDWRSLIETNLTGPFIVAKYVAREMIAAGGGKIINICSLQSELGRSTIAPYAASKGGLKMLTKGMAVDWARHNIQVNAVGPGYFITEMTKPLADDPEFDGWLRARTPAGRWGEPEELVGALLLFASPASSYINGQILYVDGGLMSAV
jgi:gluconate 5-dehydrogenase